MEAQRFAVACHDDELLITVASVLTRSVRSGDILFRLGGDEFCILMQALQLSEVKLIAERIRVNIAIALRSSNGNPCAVAASIGIATIDGKLLGDRVMRLADAAVYRAKAAGGVHTSVPAGQFTSGAGYFGKSTACAGCIRSRKSCVCWSPLSFATCEMYIDGICI